MLSVVEHNVVHQASQTVTEDEYKAWGKWHEEWIGDARKGSKKDDRAMIARFVLSIDDGLR